MVTIEEAKAEKVKLEQQIRSALKAFTEKTGLKINRIDTTPITSFGGTTCYYTLDIDVSL